MKTRMTVAKTNWYKNFAPNLPLASKKAILRVVLDPPERIALKIAEIAKIVYAVPRPSGPSILVRNGAAASVRATEAADDNRSQKGLFENLTPQVYG